MSSNGCSEFVIPITERIFVTEFCPFPVSGDLLALGLSGSILIYCLKFPEEEETISEIEFSVISEIHHDTRVQSLAWSPETSLNVAPKTLKLATADTEHQIRLFYTDLGQTEQVRTLKGHRDYVNALVYQPQDEPLIASASDDHSIILWDSQTGQRIHQFTFRSPVMAVSWHPNEVSKLLAAVKEGVIHIFNSVSYNPILSVDCGQGPLSFAHWSLSNSLLVAAALRSEWVVYDLSKPSLPIARRSQLHEEGIRMVKFANCTENLIASTGQPNYSVKVINTLIVKLIHDNFKLLRWYIRATLIYRYH